MTIDELMKHQVKITVDECIIAHYKESMDNVCYVYMNLNKSRHINNTIVNMVIKICTFMKTRF